MSWMNKHKVTTGALIVTFILALFASVGFLRGDFQAWPTIAALALHLVWVGIAFRKRLSIKKDGIEIEDDEEGEGK